MNVNKANRRDGKLKRRKYGHVVDNRNIFLLEEEKVKRAEKERAKRKKERLKEKEELLEILPP